MRRLRPLWYVAVPVVLGALAACATIERPAVQVIPDSALVYVISGKLLHYHYVDTTAIDGDYELKWLNDTTFVGVNCIALIPKSSSDTTGQFIFAINGANIGLIQRRQAAAYDTLVAYFLPETGFDQGTHGTFALDQAGNLKLFWADGTQSRYFDPSAVIKLHNDTITSNVSLSASADSIHVSWSVSWIRDLSCQ